MKKYFFILTCLFIFLGVIVLPSCEGRRVVAEVNGKKIYQEEIDKIINDLKASHGGLLAGERGKELEKDFREKILTAMINDELIIGESLKLGVKVGEKEVEEKLNKIRKMFSGEKAFKQTLKSKGMTEKSLKENIKRNLTIERAVEKIISSVKVSDREARDYYGKNQDKFIISQEAKLKEILVKEEEGAKKVYSNLEEGKSFSSQARRYSIDSETKYRGGDWGWKKKEELPAELADKVFLLKEGEVSEPIQTSAGWYIIKLVDKKVKKKSFEQAKKEIVNAIKKENQEKYLEDWLKNQRKKSKIKIYI